jgi:serine/threonine protein kinase
VAVTLSNGLCVFLLVVGRCVGTSGVIAAEDVEFGRKIACTGSASIMCGVWKGRDVAIKCFNDLVNGPPDCALESSWMSKVCHPCIVEFFGIVTQPSHGPGIVMELFPLGSVFDCLRKAEYEMPWLLRVKMARDVALALDCLHRNAVLHRDVKAGNVFVVSLDYCGGGGDSAVNCKLGDFGIACELSEALVRDLAGTPLFMAPEMVVKQPYGSSADVWSFGVMMMELAHRSDPFPPTFSLEDVYSAGVNGTLPALPVDTPVEFTLVWRACTNVKPDARPLASLVAELLDSAIHLLGASSPSPNSMQRSREIPELFAEDHGTTPRRLRCSVDNDAEPRIPRSKSASDNTFNSSSKSINAEGFVVVHVATNVRMRGALNVVAGDVVCLMRRPQNFDRSMALVMHAGDVGPVVKKQQISNCFFHVFLLILISKLHSHCLV